MQPRRGAEQTSWENQPPASGHGFGAAEDDAYEMVKPVGYEARLAFERERDAQTGSCRVPYPAGSRSTVPVAGQATARPMQPPVQNLPRRMYRVNGTQPVPPGTYSQTRPTAPMPPQGQAARNTIPMTGAQPSVPPRTYSQIRSTVPMPPQGQAARNTVSMTGAQSPVPANQIQSGTPRCVYAAGETSLRADESNAHDRAAAADPAASDGILLSAAFAGRTGGSSRAKPGTDGKEGRLLEACRGQA